jgi:SAM-dependent methyltransferase
MTLSSTPPHHHEAHEAAPGEGVHQHHAGQADLLDLDAEVVGHLDELTTWAGRHTGGNPTAVVDVGAGTGTGTVALARRFPNAHLVALDQSADMLDHLRAAALRHGVGERVAAIRADVDAAWPQVGSFDLAWAASSLHHMRDPDQVLRAVHAALRTDGVLVVVEMDGMPRFLPHDLGVGRPGLEERCRAAMAQDRWNAHPNWGPHLQRGGFALLEERTFTHRRAPTSPAAHRYAQRVFSNVRAGLADRLDGEDVEVLDYLLSDAPGSLAHRRDLTVRSSRTAWAARRA